MYVELIFNGSTSFIYEHAEKYANRLASRSTQTQDHYYYYPTGVPVKDYVLASQKCVNTKISTVFRLIIILQSYFLCRVSF